MDYKNRWRLLDETPIGGGGQGKVYQVIDEDKYKIRYDSNNPLIYSIRNLLSVPKENQLKNLYEVFKDEILKMNQMENPENHGALKVLHNPEDARDHELAKERIKKEIKAMNDISHPNLIEILDYDLDSYWFVSKYYSNGTLEERLNTYKSNLHKVLTSIRPLVEGVAEIHDANYVHRDIKSGNIFIDSTGALILGDFGLVYYEDSDHKRLSKTFDKVGSSEWMPPWGNTMKIEEVKPTFDVFSLGKLIWTMISGIPSLPYWYWDKEESDLTKMFPDNSHLWLANRLFEQTVIEEEKNCLPDAKAFLIEIDKTIEMLKVNAQEMGDNIKRSCNVCGVGEYDIKGYTGPGILQEMKLESFGDSKAKVCVCSHCGHIELFHFSEGKAPNAWGDSFVDSNDDGLAEETRLDNSISIDKDIDLILTKVSSLITSIEKMSDKQKSELATEDYGKEVNKLFALTLQKNPDLADLMPTDLVLDKYVMGDTLVSTPWSEIHSKLLALHNLLD